MDIEEGGEVSEEEVEEERKLSNGESELSGRRESEGGGAEGAEGGKDEEKRIGSG